MPLPPIRWLSYIAAPPERVYETLTTADGWDRWFTRGASLDARPGGRFVLRWQGAVAAAHRATLWGAAHADAVIDAEVVAAEPIARFAFAWSTAGHPTTVELLLAPRGDGCEVALTESGYLEADLGATGVTGSIGGRSPFAMCASGWGEALTLLKFYLEHGLTYGAVPAAGDSTTLR